MHNRIFIILILALTSCSNGSLNDLERMNLYGSIKSIQEEKRDSNGELMMTKETCFTNMGMVNSIEYFYPENKVLIKSVNHYDLKNRLTRQDFLTNDSLMLSQKYLQIDSNKDSLLAYDSNGDLMNIAVLEYNNDKQVVETKLFDLQKNLIYSETSKYDANSQLKETSIQSLDTSSNGEIYTYSYDSIGRMQICTVTNSINKFETIEKYSYESDEKNNWIKKHIKSHNGEIIAIVIRKIEYK
jgi:hypothetical protein